MSIKRPQQNLAAKLTANPPTGVKVTPALPWKKISPCLYTYSFYFDMLPLQVQQVSNRLSENFNQWGIVCGLRYYSKDKNKYFDTPEKAMLYAEKLVEFMCMNVWDKLGVPVYSKPEEKRVIGEGQ